MLPEIDIENCNKVLDEMLVDIGAWRKSMIHYIKDENPELNSAIIELANKNRFRPKSYCCRSLYGIFTYRRSKQKTR